VGQDHPGASQGAEFPAARGDLIPGGGQVGSQNYGFKDGAVLFSCQLSAFSGQQKPGDGYSQRPGLIYGEVKTLWRKKQIGVSCQRIFAD
jgi:hypothetical protein